MDEQADEVQLDEQDDYPYCECNTIPTFEEEDWNVCMCCGKPLN